MNSEVLIPVDAKIDSQVCRMGLWCSAEVDAESALERLLSDGWTGSLRDYRDIWLVDVIRPLRNSKP